jgi:hypothetical protein
MADPVEVPAPQPGQPDYRDHIAEMLERLPEQFRSQTDSGNNIEQVISAIGSAVQDLEQALQQVLTQRSIENAVGAQLDAIGSIVKETRRGLDDETYRRRVRARIVANRSNGTLEDLIRVTDLVLLDDLAVIRVLPRPVANVIVRVEAVAVTNTLADAVLFEFLQHAAAAGVRVVLESGTAPPAQWFRLDTGPGLDRGIFIDARG